MSSDPAPQAVNIERLIDDGPWSAFQKLVLLAIVLVFLVEGLDNQIMATVLPALAADWNLPAHAFAPAIAVGWAGAGIGAVAGGYVADRFGRKPALIGSLLLFGLPTLATVLVHDVTGLAMLRLLAGIGLGSCDPSALTLLTEYTPRRRQGRAIALALVVSLIGIGGCGLIATFVLPAWGWRALFLIVGTTPVVWAAILAVALKESPKHLAKLPARRDKLIRLLALIGHPVPRDAHFVAGDAPPKAGPISSLVSKPLLPATLCLWAGFLFTYMATGTVFSWAPTLLVKAGLGMAGAGQATIAQSIGGVAGTLAAGALTERLGGLKAARLFALAAAAGAALLAAAFGVSAHTPLLLLALVGLEGGLLSGTMTSLFGAAAQIYPSVARATGIGTAGTFGRGGAILSSYVGVMAMEAGGGAGLFVVPLLASGLVVVAMTLLRQAPVSEAA